LPILIRDVHSDRNVFLQGYFLIDALQGDRYKDVLRGYLTGRFPLLPEDSHRRQVCTPQSVLAGTIADVVLDISKWLILLTFSGRMSTSPKRLD
jgi:hypothetical protein